MPNANEAEDDAWRRTSQQVWRSQNNRYLIDVAFAPVTGAALAGIAFAIWSLARRRFEFPNQPGHWLLIGLGIVSILAPLVVYLRPRIQAEVNGLISSGAAFATFLSITVAVREPLRWRIAFALLSAAFGLVVLAFAVYFFRPLIALGMLLVAAFPLVAIGCAARDLWNRSYFDIFHWIGVAALLAMAAKFVVIFLVRLLSG